MSIHEAARNGMGARRALEIWGEVVMRHTQTLPESFGWPSMGIEKRLMVYGHGAKESTAITVDNKGYPVLTAPEAAVDGLQSDRAVAHWVASILAGASAQHRIFARLQYVNGKCWADIAQQMSGTDEAINVAAVEAMYRAVKARIQRALSVLRQDLQAA